ncbi:hypothetical protein J7394_21370 [Ruegeria sp. R13_0]|uniref:hypothetical protein n=1 Tax=Ruegeria sp. R13_0 TaxID=2821099 RepID=UPI001ADBECF4|nr:hypothetical protein [Ruegeria sp. R13_0]MBO9436766.1 hypothetical protein [Ruegeria sp. R13_0]
MARILSNYLDTFMFKSKESEFFAWPELNTLGISYCARSNQMHFSKLGNCRSYSDLVTRDVLDVDSFVVAKATAAKINILWELFFDGVQLRQAAWSLNKQLGPGFLQGPRRR